jgi:beta-lactamase regulating signal transducer with metallopeptidase domain
VTAELLAARWLPTALNGVVQSLAVTICAALFLLLHRRASAEIRHLALLLTLGSLLCLPFVSMVIPHPLFPLVRREEPVPQLPAAGVSPADGGTRMTTPIRTRAHSVRDPHAQPILPRPALAGRPRGRITATLPLAAGTFVLWLVGTAVCLVRIVMGVAACHRLARSCPRVAEGPVLYLVDALAQTSGARVPLTVLQGTSSDAPMTWGVLRPHLLLPAGVEAWPKERLRAVLLHELAHVQRRDGLWQLLAQLTCALYWFHPLVWLLAFRLRIESELACDDQVLCSGIRPIDYATCLLEVLRTVRGSRDCLPAAMSMARGAPIRKRLRAILDPKRNRRRLSGRARTWVLFTTVVGLISLSTLRPLATAQVVQTAPRLQLSGGEMTRAVTGQGDRRSQSLHERRRRSTRFVKSAQGLLPRPRAKSPTTPVAQVPGRQHGGRVPIPHKDAQASRKRRESRKDARQKEEFEMNKMRAGTTASGLMALGLMASVAGTAPGHAALETPERNPVRASRDAPPEVLVVPGGRVVDVSADTIRVPTAGQIDWPYDRGPLERQRGSQPVYLVDQGPRISELWARGFVRIDVSNGTSLRPANLTGWGRITFEKEGADQWRIVVQPMPDPGPLPPRSVLIPVVSQEERQMVMVPAGRQLKVTADAVRLPAAGQVGWTYAGGPLERQSVRVNLIRQGPRVSELWAKGPVRIDVSNGTRLQPVNATEWVLISIEEYSPDEWRVSWQPVPAPPSGK